MRFKLTLAYDGRPFCGWQSQAGGGSVQDELEKALGQVAGEELRAHGAGRTDAGVHALGQVAHFDAPKGSSLDGRAWQGALNTKLPRSIRVLRAEPADDDFHARFNATGKTYRYRIYCGDPLPPLELGIAWHRRASLDKALFESAAAQFLGKHDFGAFAASRGEGSEPSSTVRTITQAELSSMPHEAGGEVFSLTLSGDGFLYKMVRMITGACALCAEGKITPESIDELLAHGGPTPPQKSPLSAPGDGLTLLAVDYPDRDQK